MPVFIVVSRVMLVAWPWITRIAGLVGLAWAAWATAPLVGTLRKLGEVTEEGVGNIPRAMPFTVQPDPAHPGETILVPKTHSDWLPIALVGGLLFAVLAIGGRR